MAYLTACTTKALKRRARHPRAFIKVMENRGFEPLTPALPAQCSTTELIPHESKVLSGQTVVYYVSHENTTSSFKIAYPLARIECVLMGNLRLTFYVLE